MRGGPSIKHLDDVPAEEMLRYEFADGRTASIWEKWIELSPRYFAFWNKWDPGPSPRSTVTPAITAISSWPARSAAATWSPAQARTSCLSGDVFGPWEAGPQGCELYGFIAGEDNRSAAIPPRTRHCSRHVAPGRYRYRCQKSTAVDTCQIGRLIHLIDYQLGGVDLSRARVAPGRRVS